MTKILGQVFPEEYDTLFQQKKQKIKQDFAEFNGPEIEAYASPPQNFRYRAEFKIWHENGKASYAMYKPGEYKKPVKIESFEIGSETICQLMPPLIETINNSESLRKKLFQVEFLTTTTGDSVITLIYHRSLDKLWEQEASNLEAKLSSHIIGRSRKQKVTLSRDYVIESFNVGEKVFHYQQVETGFTQPNAAVCKAMLNWAQRVSSSLGGDLLELYCGNGNFTLPLAENFNKVLATEVSKTSVKSALENIARNNTKNVAVIRMSSEEFCEARSGARTFNRLKGIELEDYEFSTVFVDPPRVGLDPDTVEMVSHFENILYISCNPVTLKENLHTLTQTHTLKALAFFDQFPYTEHCECGVLLKKLS